MANNRVIKHLNLNEQTRELFIQFRGSSSAIEAKALDFKKNDQGCIEYILLDRLIHKSHESSFECFLNGQWENGFSISGCYVTELNRSK